jgi:hypothetical protein
MEDNKPKAAEIIHHLKEYFNTTKDLVLLTLTEKSSTALSKITFGIILTIISAFFLLFASTALALALSDYFGNSYAGFLLVAALYMFIILLLWTTRNVWLQKTLTNIFIRIFLKKGDDNEDR